MATREFRRVLLWSGWWRLSHAATGLATIVLLVTGGLIAYSPLLAETALESHYLAAAVLSFGLVVRFSMMFAGKPHERLVALLPARVEFIAMGKTALFYLTLGKVGLPRWYAHNPLWKPLYVLLYAMLLLLVASGSAMSSNDIVLGFYLPSVHAFWAHIVLWFCLLHIISACMHDYSNKTADVSAIINGYRLYLVEPANLARASGSDVQLVSLDATGNKR